MFFNKILRKHNGELSDFIGENFIELSVWCFLLVSN